MLPGEHRGSSLKNITLETQSHVKMCTSNPRLIDVNICRSFAWGISLYAANLVGNIIFTFLPLCGKPKTEK